MRKFLPLTIVPAALSLWAFFFATQLATLTFRSAVEYQTPYTTTAFEGKAGTPLSQQVIVVVVDGLRLDQSQQMASLNALRAQGAQRTMRVGQPSLSLPGWAVMATGAWQEQHGQVTNYNARVTPLDTIFLAARRAGLATAIVGSEGWDPLFKAQLDVLVNEPSPPDPHHQPAAVSKQDDAIEAAALKILKENNPNLLLIHFTAPDNMSHGYGALSAENQRAREDVDARLARLLQTLDLSRTTLIVTADHGHTDRGGHGGAEDAVLNVPFVAAGAGIRSGSFAAATQADLAPTLALLLGTSIPRDNQGDVLFDLLDAPLALKAQRSFDWAQQIVARYTTIASVIGVGSAEHPRLAQAQAALAAGDDATALAAAQAEVSATRETGIIFREGRLQQERLYRTPQFLLWLLPIGLYLWFMSRMGWEFKRPLIGALVYFIVFYALYFGRGFTFSFSMLNEDADLINWFAARVVDAMGALLASAVVMGLLSRGDDNFSTVRNAVNALFCIAAPLWFQLAIFYALYDFSWAWFLPDQSLGFKFYLDTLQTSAFMPRALPVPLALLLPLVALGTRRLSERVLVVRASHPQRAYE